MRHIAALAFMIAASERKPVIAMCTRTPATVRPSGEYVGDRRAISAQSTAIREYTTLLSRIFLLDELPPRQSDKMNRLVKTPKLHQSDTGLRCALLGLNAGDLFPGIC